MKKASSIITGAIVAVATLFATTTLPAQTNGTWTALVGGNATGNWTAPANWSGGIVAGGSNATADFNTLDITANSTVTLDTPITIGNLIFGDTATGTAASWIVDSSVPANTLTLSGTTPTVTTNPLGAGASTTISAIIAGTDVTKDGAGTLVLSGANTFTGAAVVNSGLLVLGHNSALGTTAGNTTISSGAAIDLSGRNIGGELLRISGTGIGGAGAVINSNTVTNAAGVTLSLLGNATVGGPGRIDTAAGANVIAANGHTLTKVGSGQLVIAGNTTLDAVNLNAGFTIVLNSAGGLGNATSPASVASGATLQLWSNLPAPLTHTKPVTLAGGSTLSTEMASTQILSGNVTLSGGAAAIAVHNAAATFEISGPIAGAGGFNKTAPGTLILTGNNTFAGNTTVSGGALRGSTASLPTNILNNAALVFDQASAGAFSPVISGAGAVEKTGVGNLTLSGANTFTGAALVSQGLLVLGHNSALGTTAGNTTISSGAAIDLSGRDIGGELLRISGTGIGGAGAVLNSNTAVGAGAVTLSLLGNATVGGPGRIDTAAGPNVIAANGHTLTKVGSGQLIIWGNTTLDAINIDAGFIIVGNAAGGLGNATSPASVASGATLQLWSNLPAPLTHTKPVTLAGGSTLSTEMASTQILSGNVTLSGGAAAIAVHNAAATFEISGPIAGAGGFNKTAPGTLILSGANTYTGTTTVTTGTLIISSGGSIGNGAVAVNGGILTVNGTVGNGGVTVASGATLTGIGTIGGPVSVAGTLNPGSSPGTLNFTGNLTLQSAATLNLDITGVGAGQFDILNGAGLSDTLTLGGSLALNNTGYSAVLGDSVQVFTNWSSLANNFSVITGTDLGGGLSWDISALATTGTLTVIPEPSTWALLAGSLTFLMFMRRRRRNIG